MGKLWVNWESAEKTTKILWGERAEKDVKVEY
jgi:hypothetical protein